MTNDIVERLRLLVASDSTGASIEAIAEIIRLRTQNAELVAALKFYGNPENWESVWDHQFKMMAQEPVCRDKGDTARAAIAKAEGGRDV